MVSRCTGYTVGEDRRITDGITYAKRSVDGWGVSAELKMVMEKRGACQTLGSCKFRCPREGSY